MQFALLGDHPAGVAMAAALAATGRHELACFSGVGNSPAAGKELLARHRMDGQPVSDLEEILANPAIEAVIVASPLSVRPAHLRRAAQSERHVLCVHPPDTAPDIAYEAALVQGDTHKALFPLVGECLHPAVLAFGQLLREGSTPQAGPHLLQLERWAAIVTRTGVKPTFPDWIVLRALGGEIGEVSAFAAAEDLNPDEPLLLAGRFDTAGLFQATLIPGQPSAKLVIHSLQGAKRAELVFPEGMEGPSQLRWHSRDGGQCERSWPPWQPWTQLVELFEAAVAADGPSPQPSWQDTIRCLELDDAARRSLAHRRTHTLEFQDASEEVGFKGTMTLVGCAVLWGTLGLLILAASYPALGWAIAPVLAIFLLLQVLRWVIPGHKPESRN